MAYSITNTDGSVAINIADSIIDSSTYSVDLIGQDASNYGASVAKNAIRLLENFASETAPAPGTKLIGQLWYDKSEAILKVWDGSVFKRIDVPRLASAPTSALAVGTKYFNSRNNQEYYYDGTNFRLSNYAGEVSSAFSSYTQLGEPQDSYGTKLKTIFLKDSSGVPRAVLALVHVNNSTNSSYQGATAHPNISSNETIMAIFANDTFTAGNSLSEAEGQLVNYYSELSSSNGIGVNIVKGLNLRQEYTQSSVALADLATVATTANAVYHAGRGINITANPADNNYFYSNIENIIPASDNAYDIGSSSKTFQTMYVGSIVLGESNAGSLVPESNANVTLGTSTKRFGQAYFTNADFTGNVTFGAGVQNLGTSGSPVENFYAGNVVASGNIVLNTYNWPSTATPAANTALLTDGNNNLSFQTIPLTTTQMIAGAGLTGGGTLAANRTFNVGAGSYITVNANDVAVDATTTNTSGKVVARDGSGNVYASYFNGVATSAYYADLAEIYSADAEYEAGTVIKIGGEAEITQTTSHADTEVFGVISTQPAYLMNSDSKGLPVALQGRVPVKVIGKIKKGERLISSDVPGVAWGVADEDVSVQAIIGRALQDKNDGDAGIIEAVIGVK
jgi:hypothetical protein